MSQSEQNSILNMKEKVLKKKLSFKSNGKMKKNQYENQKMVITNKDRL